MSLQNVASSFRRDFRQLHFAKLQQERSEVHPVLGSFARFASCITDRGSFKSGCGLAVAQSAHCQLPLLSQGWSLRWHSEGAVALAILFMYPLLTVQQVFMVACDVTSCL